MSTALASVPAARRRRSAYVAMAFAVVLIVVGILPWTTSAPGVIRIVATVVGVAGLIAGFAAVGLIRSTRTAAVGETRSRPVTGTGGCGGGCQCGRSS